VVVLVEVVAVEFEVEIVEVDVKVVEVVCVTVEGELELGEEDDSDDEDNKIDFDATNSFAEVNEVVSADADSLASVFLSPAGADCESDFVELAISVISDELVDNFEISIASVTT